MKTWQKGTALHIAVFLLVFGGGCYTTLRSPAHLADSAVSEAQYEQAEWDFGRGWNYQSYAIGSNYFYYHSMPWWYNYHRGYVVNTDSNDSDSVGGSDNKITRRNFDNPNLGNADLQFQLNNPRDSISATNPSQTPPDSAIGPPVNMTDDKKKENSDNKQKTNSDKVNHRGRR